MPFVAVIVAMALIAVVVSICTTRLRTRLGPSAPPFLINKLFRGLLRGHSPLMPIKNIGVKRANVMQFVAVIVTMTLIAVVMSI